MKFTPRIVVGFIANAPRQPVGMNLYTLMPQGRNGLYLDFKAAFPARTSGDAYYENMDQVTAEHAFGDEFQGKGCDWYSLNVGLTRVLGSRIAGYAAIGMAQGKTYREYYDPYHILGEHGQYYVPGNPSTRYMPNILGGLIFLLSDKLLLQLGAEAVPLGASIGLGYAVFS